MAQVRERDPVAPYEVLQVEVDKPIKRSRQIETLLSSRRAWGEISPLLFVASENGATLQSLLPNGAQLAVLSSHTAYKKVFHACAQVLDSWGVLLTCVDDKLSALRLPLQTNSVLPENSSGNGPGLGFGASAHDPTNDKMIVLEDTKSTHLFAANEPAKTVVWLSKTNQLRVYDWTVTRQLKLRSQFELTDLFNGFAEQCNATVAAVAGAAGAAGTAGPGAAGAGSSGSAGGSGGGSSSSSSNNEFLPVQKMVVLRENVVFFVLKKRWCALNLDNGRLVECDVKTQLLDALEQVSIAIAVPSRIRWSPASDGEGLSTTKRTGMQSWMRDSVSSSSAPSLCSYDVFLAGKAKAMVVTLASVAKPHGRISLVLRVVEESELDLVNPPKSAYYHHPFLLVEQQPDELVVYNFGVMRQVQTVSIKSFVTACASLSLPIGHERRRLGDEDILFAALFTVSASPFAIHLLKMRPISKQIDVLIDDEHFEEAAALAMLCPEESLLTDHERQVVLSKNALFLFEQGRFRKAMQFFALSSVDVQVVLSLYPEELLPRSVNVMHHSPGMQNDDLPMSGSTQQPHHQDRFTLKDFEDFMKERRPVTQAAIASCSSGEQGLAERLAALIWYLHNLRNSKAGLPRKELIDTVLLKCLVLMMEKPAQKHLYQNQLMDLVQEVPKSNQAAWTGCELGESEMFLRAHGQFDALLAFYSSRKLHRKALELLEELQQNTLVAAASATEITGSASAAASASSPPTYLHHITKYLQQLDRSDALLVFEFSRRVLAHDPALGLSIFTQRPSSNEKDLLELDPALVVNHLKSCHEVGRASTSTAPPRHEDLPQPAEEPEEAGSPLSLPLTDGKFLAIEYLYRVICDGRLKVPARLHDEVVYLLLDSINVELQRSNASPTKSRLSAYHRRSPTAPSAAAAGQSGFTRLTTRIHMQRGFLGLLRRKLMSFLESPSALFHPERLLSRTPPEILEERAVILARLRRHQEVLQIYALEMKETSLAEAYCNKCFDNKTADGSIYSTLLRLYLRPTTIVNGGVPTSGTGSSATSTSAPLLEDQTPASWRKRRLSFIGNETAVTAALTLMNRYADRVDVSTALELLPADTTLASLRVFFQHVMERQLDRFRNGQVKKQLAKMENFRVRQALVAKKQDYVTCWNSTCCHFCRRPIGTGTTVIRLPKGQLAHFACQPNY